ncbi:MAG TPA: sigma-70 family RNA polymerase sigma factor [Methylocella sp.]|nr:sigma-70 family RNA polymerase sigma factor [Methylocella sp.]
MPAADAALAGLYLAHAGELHGFARRRVGRQDAEDVVQDAYLHLLQRGGAATLEQPRAYLFRIAANLAVDFARKAKTRLRYAADGLDPGVEGLEMANPEAAAVASLELARLSVLFSKLPPQCREAFLLNRIEGLTHAEIAERLGVSVRTIDRFMVKARTYLQHFLVLGAPEGRPEGQPKRRGAPGATPARRDDLMPLAIERRTQGKIQKT